MDAVDLGLLERHLRRVAQTVARFRDAYGLAVMGVHDTDHAAEASAQRDAVWLELMYGVGELEATKRRLRLACSDCLVRSERTGWRLFCERHGWAADQH